MKKSPPKLVLRRETLRALAGVDLTRVVGGQDEDAAQTGDRQCNAPAVAPKPGG
jgi:hypothetical protein